MKPIYKAIPEAVNSTSQELAESLGLPWRGPGMPRLVIGRREWIALPDLGVFPLNAKTDSGARSSSIHAEQVVLSADEKTVSFTTSNHYTVEIACTAVVARIAKVRSSTGVAKKRIFIETVAEVAGGFRWRILVSLANRSDMRCPMLLGRRALSGYFLIDPQGAHLLGPRRLLHEFKPRPPDEDRS
ncbi:ATP-dependent zinc protease [bacterium]|nr:ATP-dependent zinc protease [bacterium]